MQPNCDLIVPVAGHCPVCDEWFRAYAGRKLKLPLTQDTRAAFPQYHPQRHLCARIAKALEAAAVHDPLGYEALAALKLPGANYLGILAALHLSLKPKLYVEIGVREGRSLFLAGTEARCVAIDPQPRVNIAEWPNRNTTWAICTSDRFFERDDMREKARGFDLAFIDGDHEAGQVTRDFTMLAALAGPQSIIVLHDVIPMDERTSQPKPDGAEFWTGDVWRVMAGIVAGRPDLVAFTVACPPTGLGIVGRFSKVPRIGWGPSTDRLDMDWDVLVKRLNIVDNDPAAILAALQGKEAA